MKKGPVAGRFSLHCFRCIGRREGVQWENNKNVIEKNYRLTIRHKKDILL